MVFVICQVFVFDGSFSLCSGKLEMIHSVVDMLNSVGDLSLCLCQDAAGAAQNKAHEVSGAAGEKAHQAGNMAGEKWDQTTQGASNVAGAAQDTTNDASNVLGDKWEQTKNVAVNKAAAVKEGAGSLLSQTGDAVTNAYEKVKATVTPKN